MQTEKQIALCNFLIKLYLKPSLEIKYKWYRKNNLLHFPSDYQLFAVHMECPWRARLDCIHNNPDHHHYSKNLLIYRMILN